MGFCCTGTLTWLIRTRRLNEDADWIGVFRSVAGICSVGPLIAGHPGWALPVIPLILIASPTSNLHWSKWLPRLFLANLAVMQFLQSYPVAGDQVRLSTIPVLLCALVCLADGSRGLQNVLSRIHPMRHAVVVSAMGALISGFLVIKIWTWIWFVPGALGYPHSRLAGSASLAIPPKIENQYRYLADRVRVNCEVLFTMPGMGSFNFWSGVEPPNGSNLTAWMTGFTAERQNQILQMMRSTPRACVVYNHALVQFWCASRQRCADSPLAQYILHDMNRVVERGGYEIRVQPGRTVPWIE